MLMGRREGDDTRLLPVLPCAIDTGLGSVARPPRLRETLRRIDGRRTATAGALLCLTAKRKPAIKEEAVTQQHVCTQLISYTAGSTSSRMVGV